MDIFRTLESGTLSITAMSDFSGKANTSIHGFEEDDTAVTSLAVFSQIINLHPLEVVGRGSEAQLEVDKFSSIQSNI